MPFQVIEDFRLGMDRRKERLTGVPGSLWTLKNAVINRGGEIERAKKWVPVFTLPGGLTKGLIAVANGLYVFGILSPSVVTVPAGVVYQQILHPNVSIALDRILSADLAQGIPYVIARFADGSVHHYYGGTRVLDWDAGRVQRINHPSLDSNLGTIEFLTEQINTIGVNFIASNLGDRIRITGAFNDNDYAVVVTAANGGVTNDQTISFSVVVPAGLGLQKIVDVFVGGTFDPGDKFSIALDSGGNQEFFGYDGTPIATGIIAFAYKSKMYSAGGSYLNFSALLRPDVWQRSSNLATGAGFINIASQDGGSAAITGIDVYEGSLAIFSELAVQIWNMSDAASANALLQNLRHTGTKSPRAVKSYGGIDTFYLASSGIRSLKARTATSVAFASDIGSPVDTFVQEHLAALAAGGVYDVRDAVAEIEPLDERYWLAVNDRFYVFSYFPSAQISAWSYVEPGIGKIDELTQTTTPALMWARVGDLIYAYGGNSGQTFPGDGEQIVEVEMPFYDKQAVAQSENVRGVDFGATNVWDVYMGSDPNNAALLLGVGTATGVTYRDPGFPIHEKTTHVTFKLTCSKAGNAKLSSMAFVYSGYKGPVK